jgi:hypothetical protein
MSMAEEMTPILANIGRALIAGTPEHWTSAHLELITSRPGPGMINLSNTITSPDGHREPVRPSDELLEATNQLQLLHERWHRMFHRALFTVALEADGEWRWDVHWEYEK